MTDTPESPARAGDVLTDLLPCPFCGAPAEHDSARWDGRSPVHQHTGHAIYCSGECPLPSSGGCPQFETREEAVEYWNRRAPSTALQAAEAERDAAIREMGTYARQAGEAIGRLEMSEAAGVVDGWRERAEAAEAREAEAGDLIRCLIKNEPDDIVADGGVTCLMVWRQDAERWLAPLTKDPSDDR